MAFIRPEVKQAIERFRDAIAGIAVSLLGVYWALNSYGFMSIVGTSLALAGALLVFAGIQRGRFRTGDGGPGVVYVDEGQVTFYGPLDGGSVVIADLFKVELERPGMRTAEWVLYDPGTEPLRIPTNAEGTKALFDVFGALDGLETEKMLRTLKKPRKKPVLIWQSNRAVAH